MVRLSEHGELPELFDAHLDVNALSEQDVENMRWFGLREAAAVAALSGPYERAEDVFAAWDDVERAATRLQTRFDVRLHLALGVTPDARPRRTHDEVWHELRSRIESSRAHALGVALVRAGDDDEWELMDRHLELAAQTGVPVLVEPGLHRVTERLRKLFALAESAGVAPAQLLVSGADFLNFRQIVDHGSTAVLLLGARALSANDAVDVLSRFGTRFASRVALGSQFGGVPIDVMAPAKVARGLLELGWSRHAVQRVCRDNLRQSIALR